MRDRDHGAGQNWADFIDSLHVFRAPTPRLERSERRIAGIEHGPFDPDAAPRTAGQPSPPGD
jgi:hypothetical protein